MSCRRAWPWLCCVALAARAQEAGLPAEPAPPAVACAAIRRVLVNEHPNRIGFVLCAEIDRLLADDAATRAAAGEMLHALVVEMDRFAAEVEQRDGDAHRDRERRARIERTQLGGRLGRLPLLGDEAVPALLWVWRHGKDAEERALAAFGMTSVPTATADRFFEQLLAGDARVPWALYHALQRVQQRGIAVDDAVLLRLCDHYQEDVRGYARAIAAARRLAVPEESDDRLYPGLRPVLDLAAGLTVEDVPAGAEWVQLSLPADPAAYRDVSQTVPGWLLQRGGRGREWRLLTAYGQVLAIAGDGIDARPSSLAGYAQHLLAERERYAATEDSDVHEAIEAAQGLRRSWHGSNDEWRGSPAELLAAAWALAAGDEATAARVLHPLVAEAWASDEVLQPLLFELAGQLDEAMLGAFANARDYERALQFARRLAAPALSGFEHHDRACELAEQLPRRTSDFHELQLPTPAEWQQFRKDRPRAEQIVFLVQRLRLLQCPQQSNPGGVWYSTPQDGATGGGWREPTDPRVNPFDALLGLDLAAEELAALLPALESRDYVLGYDLERFLPQRPSQLHRVSLVAATVCNAVAQAMVTDPRRFLGDAAERARAREELLAFGREHRGQRYSDLLLAQVGDEDDWQEVRSAFWQLERIDPVRAAAAMVERARRDPQHLPDVVRLIALLDRGEFVGEARDWLQADDADQRFFAAVLLLRHRVDAERAFAEVHRRLAKPGTAPLAPGAVEALLACGLPAARAELAALLSGQHPSGYVPTVSFAQRLLRAGDPLAHEALARALRGEGPVRAWTESSDAALVRREVLARVGAWWRDVGVGPALVASETRPVEFAAELAERLAADWRRIGAGEAPTFRTEELELPWGELRTFSTGWIRRM